MTATTPTDASVTGNVRRHGALGRWNPLEWPASYWNAYTHTTQIWWTRHAGPKAVAAHAQERLQWLVRRARARSPFFRELYRDVSRDRVVLDELPVVNKRQLMSRFEDWVTDRAIRRADVEAFLDDRKQIGDKFLGRYYVWKSSGTTGVPGIYVQDRQALAIYDALVLAQLDLGVWSADYALRMFAAKGRAALVVATGDHYASIASWQRAYRANPSLRLRSFSVMSPIPKLVEELNEYRPAFVASYPTVLGLLAEEQAAGRLRIAPVSLWSGGECLAPAMHAKIESVFGCPLNNEYGASECLSIGHECRAGWLHVNSDWVVLEAVDADHRPVKPGEASHTTLLTNLVNGVQPIIRYDLGDSIIVNPHRCECHNPLPAIRVEGRRDEVLVLRGPAGENVQVLPMAIGTAIELAGHLHRFQVVQTAPDALALRLDTTQKAGTSKHPTASVLSAVRRFLDAQGLPNVTLALDSRPPQLDVPTGKLRITICEPTATAGGGATPAANPASLSEAITGK